MSAYAIYKLINSLMKPATEHNNTKRIICLNSYRFIILIKNDSFPISSSLSNTPKNARSKRSEHWTITIIKTTISKKRWQIASVGLKRTAFNSFSYSWSCCCPVRPFTVNSLQSTFLVSHLFRKKKCEHF